MERYPDFFRNEEELEEALAMPSEEVIEMVKRVDGDIIFLGVAGKMGVSLARMAKKACDIAGIDKTIYGVSRFSSEEQQNFLQESGIETIKGDLIEQTFMKGLPEVENVFYLAGMKFGTEGNESVTWAMNSYLPGLVAEKFRNSKIVAFSTGCVYPLVSHKSGGSRESDAPEPIGEYAQSCLGRERLFEFGSKKYKTPVSLIRLFYAVEMRYGVLVDVAAKVWNEEPVDVTMGYANVIWQGDANAMILQTIEHCQCPALPVNITGPEMISIRETALKFGELMNKEVTITGQEAETALLGNTALAQNLLGGPKVPPEQVMTWTARWIADNQKLLGKPTHFETRDGKY